MGEDIFRKIESLRKKIRKYNDLYYKHGISEISDFEYDMLLKELEQLEKQSGQEGLFSTDTEFSPASSVGSDLTEGFRKIKHKTRMLSMANSYNSSDLIDFDNRIKKIAGSISDIEYCVEYKIDGIAVSLIYEKGKLLYAATRGDGETGDDITANFKTLKEIPFDLKKDVDFEVRGEIYINKQDFKNLNKIRETEGLELLANPRNATAGSIKLLDISEVRKRPLKMICYYLGGDVSTRKHSDNIGLLRNMGFPAISYCKVCGNINEVIQECSFWEERKNNLEYDIDGLVIKVNDLNLQAELGDTAKSPRWVMAYKFSPERAETVLKEIQFQVGRTGAVTPVAVLEPVQISGTVVKRASLHNYQDLSAKDLRIGDSVFIEKAGEIIPQIVSVNLNKRSPIAEKFSMIERCPACNEILFKPEDEAVYRCVNASCPAQIQRQIEHFASKAAMDISGLGPSLIKSLLEAKIISDISSLYDLKTNVLSSIERMGEKSSANLIRGIEESKSRGLENLIFALGIRQVGKEAAVSLARYFKAIESLMSAGFDELTIISDVGEKTAESIVSFFKNPKNVELIDKLKEHGVNTVFTGSSGRSIEFFVGKTFVITGSFESLDREELKDLIVKSNGKVSTAVGKSTDYLICGSNPGSKYEKAMEQRVEIINQSRLDQILAEKDSF
jgi:DNA ligase (NAD+)